jgi:hypothetical protein
VTIDEAKAVLLVLHERHQLERENRGGTIDYENALDIALWLLEREPAVAKVVKLAAEFGDLDSDDHDVCVDQTFAAAQELEHWETEHPRPGS